MENKCDAREARPARDFDMEDRSSRLDDHWRFSGSYASLKEPDGLFLAHSHSRAVGGGLSTRLGCGSGFG